MKRCQVLLTPELVAEVKKIAQNQGFSQSKVVRRLLSQALAFGGEMTEMGRGRTFSKYRLHDLSGFKEKNQRIDGFREIFSVGGRTPEIRIIDNGAFLYYQKNKGLPSKLAEQILKAAFELRTFSVQKKLVVRRAYVVPGLKNPPGPRFLGVVPENVNQAIKKIFDYALEADYHLKKKAQIGAFFYPFGDPPPLSLPVKLGAQLPYGGYAVPLNKRASRVEIFAVWGNNEGVQSFEVIDRYFVDSEKKTILEKNVPQKKLMLMTTKRFQSEKVSVPQDRQFEQVLSDSEILECARVVRELSFRYGLRRVEFSFDGQKGILFNESTPYKIFDKRDKEIKTRGIIKTLSLEKDIKELANLKPNEAQGIIAYIDRKVVRKRAYDVLNSLAGLSTKLTVLYPGLSATAHAMRILTDFGHTALAVGNQRFNEGEEVAVKSQAGRVKIDYLSRPKVKNWAIDLREAKLFGRGIVGGKAVNLSLLKSKGFSVPSGIVFTTEFFEEVLKRTMDKVKFAHWQKEGCLDPKVCRQISTLEFKVDDSLWEEAIKVVRLEPGKQYAVRSSADVEDEARHSFAGQFKSFLNVDYAQIKPCVLAVHKSAFAPRIEKYFRALEKPWLLKMAVVVHEMIKAQKAGVVFGKDVQTGNEDLMIIDVVRGLATGVVEGTAKSQRIIYSRSKDTYTVQKSPRSKTLLTKAEVNALVEMTLSIENLMGARQDIEWAIDKKGEIWLIQTRSLG